MLLKKRSFLLLIVFAALLTLLAGCGGGSGVQRIAGLSPDGVVKAFVSAAKTNQLAEASLYVSQVTKTDPKAVSDFLANGLGDLKDANVAAIKVIAQSGDYAAVMVTLQQENTFKISVKPVGLERISGEWYIVDANQIYQNAKYSILAELLKKI